MKIYCENNNCPNLIQELLDNGFTSQRIAQKANLEDVFINLTGNELTQR